MGNLTVRAIIWLLHVRVHSKALELLPAQFLGYGFLFLALYLLLKMHYGRPFWQSLRWIPARISVAREVLLGFLLAIAVASLGALLQTPDVANPMKELLLSDRTSMLPVAGILLASLPFGLLHLQQYGWSWRHVLLITLAGVAFGWMRQISGSTKASAVMHSAYNFLFFVGALLAQGNKLPTTW
jgi:membrane protease YdiL (CAAX protease family)